ncbi:hypothetical protein KXD40_006245 [Peronospora effusa]|uniref:3-oxo-5-alpha-steroid 4-dehydrogenase C-terminal domain-containing protein n=1 Tax=Peronospora effusa TaxID=542832 RepID=A0A3M6VHH4_9STRA|nr:hypothetical protein DD238_006096 [Peronospora effusa]UIZ25435.1 hypothetical protein KXD40_006245 [Peronospora effusa]
MLELWQFTWLLAIACALVSFQSNFCRGFVLQGKMRTSAQLPGLWLLHLEVPKSYWTWFYLIGALHSILMLLVALFWQKMQVVQDVLHFAHPLEETDVVMIQPHIIKFLTLFAVHTTRRFLESLLVTEFGDAKMHACSRLQYILLLKSADNFKLMMASLLRCLVLFVGTYHYVVTVVSVLFDPDSIRMHKETTLRHVMLGWGIVLFAFASYHQMRCNYLLAKQKRANYMKHVVPHGDWFDTVRNPLYTTEIMLYASFILVTGGTTAMLYLVSAWVVANQVLLANMSSQWIENKFRDRRNELPKWKLVPFVW